MHSSRAASPGRIRRLTEELREESLGVLESSVSPAAVVEELDYAMRPPRHERRVPSYGSIVAPSRPVESWAEPTGLGVAVSPTTDRADGDVRLYADGVASWTVRDEGGIDALVVFDRPSASERDLVVLAEATGATMVQRHPSGVVRLAGSFGVVRWDGAGWHREPQIGEWLHWAACGLDDAGTDLFDRFLEFAVHDLGARGIGATIVFGPSDRRWSSFELRLPSPPPLRIERPSDLGPLRHVLSQIDGAAVFDVAGTLRHLGARLVPSRAAEVEVEQFRGTRHTSARRFSYDDPTALVVVVSEDGPVTVFRGGDLVGRSPDVETVEQANAGDLAGRPADGDD